MTNTSKSSRKSVFPKIRAEILGRLSDEADLRTLPPQDVDWDEIHRLAAEARKGT